MDFHPARWQRLGRGRTFPPTRGTRRTLSTRRTRRTLSTRTARSARTTPPTSTTQRHCQQIAPFFGQRIRRHSFLAHVLKVLLRGCHHPLKNLSPHFFFLCIARLNKDGRLLGVVNQFQTIFSSIGLQDTGVGVKDIRFIGVDTLLFVLQAQHRVGKIHHKQSSFPIVARLLVQVTRGRFMDKGC